MLSFFIGVIVGGALGMVVMALAVQAGRNDGK